MSHLTLKMPSFLLWIIWEIMFMCVWSLWRSGYAIRLSICSRAEAVEPNCGAKSTKQRTQQTRQRIRKLLRKKRAATYDHKETPEVSTEADTECKEFRMKQQQEAFQMLLSSHLVQLVWYRAVVEALIQLRKQDEKPLYVNAAVQTLPLPPSPPLPSESHVQVDPPDPILPRVRPPSPLPPITTPEPPEAQHVDPTPT